MSTVIGAITVAVAVAVYLRWGLAPIITVYRLGYRLGQWQLTRKRD